MLQKSSSPHACRSIVRVLFSSSAAARTSRIVGAFLLGCGLISAGQDPIPSSTSDLTNKTIRELMNMDVVSVSRKEQRLSKTPAAVYVITQEDIHRSGVRTIPDALRMAPGVQVSQLDANRWAISVRGFNDTLSNKLLVLVDGRTVYSPVFSGVYWEQLNIPMEIIDRIEVVRGPGGSMWGANAVNGVINIITKKAKDTQGLSLSQGVGSSQRTYSEAVYGGNLGNRGFYRIFGDFTNFADSHASVDGWHTGGGGVRADWTASRSNSVSIEGDLFSLSAAQRVGLPGYNLTRDNLLSSGGSIMTSWDHSFAGGSTSTVRLSDTQYARRENGYTQSVNVVDLDFQHHFKARSRNDIVWGGGYRFTSDSIDTKSGIPGDYSVVSIFIPPSKTFGLFSTFVQDEVSLNDSLSFTVGSKLEHNAFTGFEIEPAARLNWLVTEKQTLWAAVSQAIRQPSRVDTGINETGSLIGVSGVKVSETLLGNPNLQAERLRTVEAGYKFVPKGKLSIDTTAFYGSYHNLVSVDLSPPTAEVTRSGALFTAPFSYGNAGHAKTYGTEVAVNWIASQRWRLAGSYSWLNLNTTYSNPASIPNYKGVGPDIFDLLAQGLYKNIVRAVPYYIPAVDPSLWSTNQKLGFQSYWNVTPKITFDNGVYQVSSLSKLGIPAYTRVDARLGWKLSRSIEASVTGQNLLSSRHFEFGAANLVAPAPVSRSVFGRLELRF